jgi:uncharacterized protein
MPQADPRQVLEAATTVAVVGCSADPSKDAHRIPSMLMDMGFDVHPVNPHRSEILGMRSAPMLEELVTVPDLVIVFRPSEEAADVTRDAVAVGASAVWLQQGIVSEDAERIAAEAGIAFVQDRCSGVDAQRFGITKAGA